MSDTKTFETVSKKFTVPWTYYELYNLFDNDLLSEIRSVMYNSTEWEQEDREEPRYYLPLRRVDYNEDKFTKRIVDHITNDSNISFINKITNNNTSSVLCN